MFFGTKTRNLSENLPPLFRVQSILENGKCDWKRKTVGEIGGEASFVLPFFYFYFFVFKFLSF